MQKARDSDKINSITRVKYSYLNPRFILFHFTCIYSKSLVISDFDSFESEDDALPPETVTLSSPERSILSDNFPPLPFREHFVHNHRPFQEILSNRAAY